ncbi:FAD-binding oxidoreductase [Streptomyces sp. MUM 203J]|uniref:FAD-binding and (Fe-S)-binding domain-containing protein n=1 Tax=Streptomyces sp. MUM 203J TaxID=2791990 RepID=UPI001F03311B|nr:FAD-binding and (Fe-S)-binding domain-containing protein [Streptomyces sp. MUM 203J]MCH0539996.1 FAD-binding oxidoreductase [Streptomyces sp. MUM 203J]
MPLLEPDPDALRHGDPARVPFPDRVADLTAHGTPSRLREELKAVFGAERVLWRVQDLVRYASDASPYRFVPQVVLVAQDIDDVSAILSFARGKGREVVFRAAGTSLNGQAQGEDILVDVRRHWEGVEVLDAGARVRVRPGTTVGRVNAALARYGRVLGPDPASAAACTVGGAVANNASGMTAGTERNAYRTMASVTAVLPSGTVVDTGDPAADEELARAEPVLCAALMGLRAEIEGDPALAARIRAKYAIKNTNGYRLDAFLDGRTPVEILRGLMVGSQGTLGFIAEAVFDTLPLDRAVSAALLLFPSLPDAAAAVPSLAEAGAAAVELMDGASLRDGWPGLPRDAAALLVELRAADESALEVLQRVATAVVERLGADAVQGFTRDPAAVARLWSARRGFAAAVGGSRPSGTTLITEEFAVPPHRLAEACEALRKLQAEHGFDAAVAGHAAHGNLHFLLAFDPADPADVDRYAAFMEAFCRMVVERFDGSLKAEHATGRNIAPFLELEWGPRATELMWRTKQAFDPDGVLAPRVVLDRDPRGHLRGLKSVPAVGDLTDPCIECGFCEPVCPSRDLTTTPRQRIALRREMARQGHGSPVETALAESYGYEAVDTCAVEGSCGLACPVGIDTGALMKRLRHARHSEREERAAALAARNFASVEAAARSAVAAAHRAGRLTGDRLPQAVTGALRWFVRPDLVPEWLPELPGAAAPELPRTEREGAAAVYFPACVNRIFGGPPEEVGPSLPEAVVALSERAGLPVWIPEDVRGTCCATIWASKGYAEGAAVMAERVVEAAWGWTEGGRLPLVVDASSCALGLGPELVPHLSGRARELHGELTVLDATVWAADRLLPRLAVRRRVASAVVHPTCAARRLGAEDRLSALAAVCAREVVVPDDAGCCAFAGDRGLLHRELTEAATAREAVEVTARAFDVYLSAGRMCETGMRHATGRPYRSVLVELERATRP